jgi:hypothetical protein
MTTTVRSRDGVLWWYSTVNRSPRVTAEFLARQRRLLMPGQYRREHENAWVDSADSFTTAAVVDDAMDGSWIESPTGEPGVAYVHAWDLGLVHDPTVGGVAHVEGPWICVDRLLTFQGSREQPVQFADLKEAMSHLRRDFPPTRILIESWQGAAVVQELACDGWPVELVTPTARTVADQWNTLSQALVSRRLVLPVHPRLREELLNLTVEIGPSGPRVVDRGQVHQDHAVVVRMLTAALAVPALPEPRLIALG